MVNCQQALEQICDLVNDDLGFRHRMRLRLHLLICRYCQRYLSSYRTTIRAEKNAFLASDELVAEEIPDELVARILAIVSRR